jgi:hypothetical protein
MTTQAEIADWMRAMMAKHRIAARAWCEKAKLGKDTVGRALKPDYDHITSTRTLAKLAAALGEPTPGSSWVPQTTALVPAVELLCEASRAHDELDPDDILALAETLRDALLSLADEPEAAADPKLARLLVRREFRRALPRT